MVRPQALAVDYVNKQLYWADSYLDKIERINYDMSGRLINVVKSTLVEKVVSLDIFQDFLYITSYHNNSLSKLSKYYSDDEAVDIDRNSLGPSLVKVIHRQRQPLRKCNIRHVSGTDVWYRCMALMYGSVLMYTSGTDVC